MQPLITGQNHIFWENITGEIKNNMITGYNGLSGYNSASMKHITINDGIEKENYFHSLDEIADRDGYYRLDHEAKEFLLSCVNRQVTFWPWTPKDREFPCAK